jgi:hypothetical protein
LGKAAASIAGDVLVKSTSDTSSIVVGNRQPPPSSVSSLQYASAASDVMLPEKDSSQSSPVTSSRTVPSPHGEYSAGLGRFALRGLGIGQLARGPTSAVGALQVALKTARVGGRPPLTSSGVRLPHEVDKSAARQTAMRGQPFDDLTNRG